MTKDITISKWFQQYEFSDIKLNIFLNQDIKFLISHQDLRNLKVKKWTEKVINK